VELGAAAGSRVDEREHVMAVVAEAWRAAEGREGERDR